MKSMKTTFAGGEIAPDLEGRVDITRYNTSVQKATNFYTTRFGAIENRPGTKYVCDANRFETNDDWAIKFIPFEFSVDQSYLLEFTGNDTTGIMRVIKDGSIVLTTRRSAAYKWTASGSGSDEWYLELAAGGDPFPNGEGANEVWENGTIMTRGTAGSLAAGEWDLADNDTLGYSTIYVRLAVTGDPDSQAADFVQSDYQVATGIIGTQVSELTGFTQSADTVFIVHEDFAPKSLVRNADDDWTIGAISFNPSLSPPLLVSTEKSAGLATPQKTVSYGVSSVNGGVPESLMYTGTSAEEDVDNVWPAGAYMDVFINPLVFSPVGWTQIGATGEWYMASSASNPYLYAAGGRYLTKPSVIYEDKVEMTEVAFASLGSLNDGEWTYGDPATLGYDVVIVRISGGTSPSLEAEGYLTMKETSDPEYYRIYKNADGDWGWLADVDKPWFRDQDVEADITIAPKFQQTVFSASGDYPRAVTIYEQRLLFAGTTNEQQGVYLSSTGDYLNFTQSRPLSDDDYILARMSSGGRQDGILHLAPLDKVMVFTTGSEWALGSGSNSDALTPFTVNYKRQGYTGAYKTVKPLPVDNEIMFVHRNGKDIRSMRFRLEDENYTGDILTYYVPHIFKNKTIVDWCYQQHPQSIAWIVLSDGTFVTMTYIPEQQIVAFCRQETDGNILACESIVSGESSDVYFATSRTLNGSVRYMIEKLADREFSYIHDAYFVDCGLTYDNPITISNVALSATAVTVTATAHPFVNGDFVFIRDVEGIEASTTPHADYSTFNYKWYQVANKTANTFELTDYDGSALTTTHFTGTYERNGTARESVLSVSGLDHLEGESVDVLADGSVYSKTVSSGSITLADSHPGVCTVHAGLGYNCDVQTLRLEEPSQDGVMQTERKRIKNIILRMKDSVGGYAGIDEASLTEIKWRQNEDWRAPNATLTGDREHTVPGGWNTEGRVYFRQSDPLPTTILAIIQRYELGGPS